MDDARTGFRWLDFKFGIGDFIHCDHLGLAVGDYDGDGVDEIFASNWVIRRDEGGTAGTNATILHRIFELDLCGSGQWTPNVWMGDLDGDMKDELLY